METSSGKIAIFLIKCLALLGFALPVYAGTQQFSGAKYFSPPSASISADENTPEANSPCSSISLAIAPTIGTMILPSCYLATNLGSEGFTLKRYLITHSGNDPPASAII